MPDGPTPSIVTGQATASSRMRRPGLSRASQRLVLAGGALLVGMIVAVALAMINTRNHALHSAQIEAQRLSKAIAEQTATAFQAVDIVVTAFRDEAESQGYASPTLFAALNTPQLQKELARQATLLPQADAFAVIDATGHLLTTSRRWPAPHIDFSDRSYVRYFRDHDDRGVFLSDPMINRVTGLWTCVIARRIDSPTGTLLGIVVGLLDLGYFRSFYREIAQGENLAITLVNRQGLVLTSYPYNLPPGQRPWGLRPAWDQLLAQTKDAAVLTAPGLVGHERRLIAMRPLQRYPVVINVSISTAGALADWRQQSALIILGSVCAVLCMILLLRAIVLQFRRLERSEADLAQNAQTLATTLDHISQGIVMMDGDGRVAVCNRQAIAMLDLPPGLLASHPFAETILDYQVAAGEFPDPAKLALYRQSLFSDQPQIFERERPNGRILEVQSLPMADGGAVRTYSDVTERRRSEERIRYLAHHDPLTKLANRTLFTMRLEEEIARADAQGHRLALLYIDLDRFKYVNDSHGHGAGDALLVKLGERLTQTVGADVTIARTGGDEFAVILPLDNERWDAKILARDIVAAVQQPLAVESLVFRASVSVGIAHYPDHAKSASDLLRNADIALYEAKNEGTGLVRVFDAGMEARQQQLFQREQDLRSAFELGQFEVVYQPILNLERNRVAGAEALLRWHHPSEGLVLPADFIMLAERLGLILPLGLWVLETACQEAAHWPGETTVAVNLSPLQVNSESLVTEVQQILQRTGLAPHRLILEVTEGLLLEQNPTVLRTMHALRALGVRFSLDDFGTGHSGLGYLRRFPFDVIKIDKLFVQDMVDHPDAAAIVNALLAVSAELGLEVVAEGVETVSQLEMLRQRHCPYVQGYLVSRPLDSAQMRSFTLKPWPSPIFS